MPKIIPNRAPNPPFEIPCGGTRLRRSVQAFITMFRITAGDTVSLPSLPMVGVANGAVDYRVALFTISYVVIVIWVLLQAGPARPRSLSLVGRGYRRPFANRPQS